MKVTVLYRGPVQLSQDYGLIWGFRGEIKNTEGRYTTGTERGEWNELGNGGCGELEEKFANLARDPIVRIGCHLLGIANELGE